MRSWKAFDGIVSHLTCPFKWESYSVILFTRHRYAEAADGEKLHLVNLGINMPPTLGLARASLPPRRERLKAAIKHLPPDLAHCMCNIS